MSAREDERRREDAFMQRIERSKGIRGFDAEVARLHTERLSRRAIAKRLGVSPTKVLVSLVWQELVTGRAHRGVDGVKTGRIKGTAAAVYALRELANHG